MHTPSSSAPSVSNRVDNETILLVEDETQLRVLVASGLRRHGYQVLEASRPSEAIFLAETHPLPIHLLLTDVMMPEMGGAILAEKLITLHPQIHVLFMSGYTNDAILQDGVQNASIPFIQKPFKMDKLTHVVREVMNSPLPHLHQHL